MSYVTLQRDYMAKMDGMDQDKIATEHHRLEKVKRIIWIFLSPEASWSYSALSFKDIDAASPILYCL